MKSKLRSQFIDHLTIRGLAANTIDRYVQSVVGLVKHYRKPADQITRDQTQTYLLHLIKDKQLAGSTIGVNFAALRNFYTGYMKQPQSEFSLPKRRDRVRLPVVWSIEEVEKFLALVKNVKHRALLMTTYSGGFRVSEVVNLQFKDIESKRMMIRVNQSKGNKDRYTILPPSLLEELRSYYKIYRPQKWLFEGGSPGMPMTISTAQQIFKKAKLGAGILKPGGIHTLRHCFATHLLDQGVHITELQKLLGHKYISSTAIYLHVTNHRIDRIVSPLESFNLSTFS